ncbi:hypothetical protein [Natronosalvus vescus]|uniref:hypothetical protein n=1 Tax=Natronosalvus vescus TaxID=2953881 RepID=UPI002091B0FF|nr:hypothetical protein [Natronosalvus vescus]
MRPPASDSRTDSCLTRATTTPLQLFGLVIVLGVVFALVGVLLWIGLGVAGPGIDDGASPSPGSSSDDERTSNSSHQQESEPEGGENESESADGMTQSQDTSELSVRLDAMETTLADEHGIEIQAVYDTERGVIEVEHVTDTRSQNAYAEDAREITAAYGDLIQDGYDVDRMAVSVMPSSNGPTVASWHVEQAWAEAYMEGELSEDELADRIQETASLG